MLAYPWQSATGQQFSVGTRFKRIPEHDTETAYAIIRGDYEQHAILYEHVPHQDALGEIERTPTEKRRIFVGTIQRLLNRVAAQASDQVIPYVWGGSSFLQSYNDLEFYQQDGVWQRTGKSDPYTGYDCSELIMRMAHIAGIDFPWKTTVAIQQNQRALLPDEPLEEGDIIWTQGHVMIISNIPENELIEARGYGAGYGRVHQIKLEQAFADIATYDDLIARHHEQGTVTFKNRSGESLPQARRVQLLKLIN